MGDGVPVGVGVGCGVGVAVGDGVAVGVGVGPGVGSGVAGGGVPVTRGVVGAAVGGEVVAGPGPVTGGGVGPGGEVVTAPGLWRGIANLRPLAPLRLWPAASWRTPRRRVGRRNGFQLELGQSPTPCIPKGNCVVGPLPRWGMGCP